MMLRLFGLMVLATIPRCVAPEAATNAPIPAPAAAPLRESKVDAVARRSLYEFDHAILLKPRDTMPDRAISMAPLIVLEIEPEAPSDGELPSPGALATDGSGRTYVDTMDPTVYVTESTLRHDGHDYDQLTHLWWLGAPAMRVGGGATTAGSDGAALCGVRMTLDDDGFPVVWEVRDRGDVDRLFVSHSLESAARAAFGPPLPRRRYAIERAIADAPRSVVVRVLDDGPIPMGPYVYIDRDGRVTTVLCRCMPSQVGAFDRTADYDIRPAETLSGLDSAAARWISGLAQDDPETADRSDGAPVTHRLRWPLNRTGGDRARSRRSASPGDDHEID